MTLWMKLIVLITTFYFSISLHAQEGFSTSGGQALGEVESSSYAVGQTVYDTYTGSTGSVAQGIQQTYYITALLGAAHAFFRRCKIQCTF